MALRLIAALCLMVGAASPALANFATWERTDNYGRAFKVEQTQVGCEFTLPRKNREGSAVLAVYSRSGTPQLNLSEVPVDILRGKDEDKLLLWIYRNGYRDETSPTAYKVGDGEYVVRLSAENIASMREADQFQLFRLSTGIITLIRLDPEIMGAAMTQFYRCRQSI